MKREEFDANGLKVTFIDITGRFSSSMAMFKNAGNEPQDDYRMLGAIVETPKGNVFLKGLGPAKTMGAHREEFLTFLRSMRPS